MFSWSIEARCPTSAAKEEVWKLWANVATWPQWDHGLDWCRLEGPFAVGTKGTLQPTGSKPFPFVLTHVDPGHGYIDVTQLPLTKLIFTHKLHKLSNVKCEIHHQARCTGLLAPLLYFNLRRALKKGMPQAVAHLAQLAERGGK